jgi:hypothetical protein
MPQKVLRVTIGTGASFENILRSDTGDLPGSFDISHQCLHGRTWRIGTFPLPFQLCLLPLGQLIELILQMRLHLGHTSKRTVASPAAKVAIL